MLDTVAVDGDVYESAVDRSRALVERARAGDRDAFRSLVVDRLLPTFRVARAILGTTEEAEDVTQEAFLAAWRGLPSLRDVTRFDAWFGRIVANACRSSVRHRPPIAVLSVEAMAEAFHDAPSDGSLLSDIAEADALRRAMARLTVEQRTILALHHLEKRPIADVAVAFGIPAGTAKWRLFEARAALERAVEAER
jgi:RNA polymerase sigma-70 factor (ECF subfamily)